MLTPQVKLDLPVGRAVTTGGAGGAIAPPVFLDGPKRSRKYEFLNDILKG